MEDVQNFVEQALMGFGSYDVARAYIFYRERCRELREARKQAVRQRTKERALFVTKRKDRQEPFNENKLKHYFQQSIVGYEGV